MIQSDLLLFEGCRNHLRTSLSLLGRFFGCQLLGSCSGRFALQSATTIHEKDNSMFVKATKHSQSLARTMKELIKQSRKQINPPRKSASETRDPFRKVAERKQLNQLSLGETACARSRSQSPLKCSSTRCSEAPPDHIVKTSKFAPKCR